MLAREDFSAYQEYPFVLIWKGQYEVDLLPFGQIEEEVKIEASTGFTAMPGFWEIYEEELPEVELKNSPAFKLCPLPLIVLLKFISWHDRPEMRTSDILDISDILRHYFDMFDESIFKITVIYLAR